MNVTLIFTATIKLAAIAQLITKPALAYFTEQEKLKLFSTEKGGAMTHADASGVTVVWHFGKDKRTTEEYQNEGAKALRAVKGRLAEINDIELSAAFGADVKGVAQHIEKGMLLANFAEDAFKSKKSKQKLTLKNVGDKRLRTIVDAIERTRALVSTPANILTTEAFVDEIKALKKESKAVSVKILRKKELKKEKMHLLLAVGAASVSDPALAVIEYAPAGTAKDAPVILIGKGLIYDSGGYGIKPGDSMADMYADMAGAATVVGVITALARLGVKRRVVGVCGICENLINEVAMKNGDIITSKKGLTVEVQHTDAEGRLVLADCLTYAQEHFKKPAAIFDFATLTGAVVYSLGEMYTGVFTDSDDIATRVTQVGTQTNDWVWRMPFDNLAKESVKGERSDIINLSSIKRMLGHATAAAFLARFIDEENMKTWAHFDIAGTGMRRTQKREYDPKGLFGSGGMVHTMIEFLSRDEKVKTAKAKKK